MGGGVVGAHLGTIAGQRLRAEQLRFLLAIVVLAVGVRLGIDLLASPHDLFSLKSTGG
jgi:uncharacterized membrane protein YfcA